MFKINLNLIIHRYEIIIVAIVFLLTGSIVVSSRDTECHSGPFQQYPYRIALTFDDGPHPAFTDRIIARLKEHSVPATFFIVGKQAAEHPYLVQHLAAAGHELAGHTLTHRNLSRLSDAEIRKELIATRTMIEELAHQETSFFRPPGGQYNERVIKVASTLDLDMVLWSVFPRDHEEESVDAIVQRVLDQATDGGVVLLHSGREPTLAALPRIIKELRERGYRFVTVTELRKTLPPEQLAWVKSLAKH